MPPPTWSNRMTSAPSWANVMPPDGAATNAVPSMTRSPSSGRAIDTSAIGPSVPTFNRDSGTSPDVVQHRLGVGLEVLTSKVVAADDGALRVD